MLDPTGVRSKHQIRKTPTGCRGFLLPIFFRLGLDVHLECELKSLLGQ